MSFFSLDFCGVGFLMWCIWGLWRELSPEAWQRPWKRGKEKMGKAGNFIMSTFYFYYYKDKQNRVCVYSLFFLSFTDDKLLFPLPLSRCCCVPLLPRGETFTNLRFSFRAVWIVKKRRDEGRAQTPLMSAEWGRLLIDACDSRIISLKVITLSSMLHRHHLATAVENKTSASAVLDGEWWHWKC